MKKFISMAVLVVLFLCPFAVRADLYSVTGKLYAESVGADSNIIMEIASNGNYSLEGLDGILDFDNTTLQLVNVELALKEGIGTAGKVEKTDNGSQIKLSVLSAESNHYLKLTFKVKKVPSNGIAAVTFTPKTNGWGGDLRFSIKIAKEKECPTCPTCPTCSKDEVTCPVCETCQECESCDNNASDSNVNQKEEKETSNNNNMALYVSLGACAVLAVSVIVLAVKKS